MTRKRFALLAACLVCLLMVSVALPAADPRLDAPGTGTETTLEDESSLEDADRQQKDGDDENGDQENGADRDDQAADEPWIHVGASTPLTPGQMVVIDLENHPDPEGVDVLVGNGADRTAEELRDTGQSGSAGDQFGVGYESAITIHVPEYDLTETVPVQTDATLTLELIDGSLAPEQRLNVSVKAAGEPLSRATVSMDGDTVTRTDEDGKAMVRMPPEGGPIELVADRGAVSGERTVEVAKPSVAFDSWFLFPGLPTTVSVTGDGDVSGPISGATVTVGDQTVQTDSDGTAVVTVPVSDEVTATAEVGAERTETTVSNLYLRTGGLLLIVPGLLFGSVWTYLQLAARYNWLRPRRRNGFGVVLGLAGLLSQLDSLFMSLGRPTSDGSSKWRLPTPSLPSFSLPRFELPSLTAGGGFGLGSTLSSLGSRADRDSKLGSLLGSDDASENSGEATAVTEQGARTTEGEEEANRTPRNVVYDAWHRFVSALGVSNRTRRTPGEIARRGLSAGLSQTQVQRLLDQFRAVEYSEHEPTDSEATEAQETASSLAKQLQEDDDE